MKERLDIIILGLSITSSWGNEHATTYRGLVRELHKRGHHVLFLERDVDWYTKNRDLPNPPYGKTDLYSSLNDLEERYIDRIREADVVLVGSYVPEGVAVGEWVNYIAEGVTAFYDIDTPVTLAKLKREDYEYLHPSLIKKYDIYFSFSGGHVLEMLEKQYRSPMAVPLYCSVDPDLYFPEDKANKWDMGYLGTYSDDRQPPLEILMLDAARQWPKGSFIVAGPQYPEDIAWPENVERKEHLPPAAHRDFYNTQRFTLNVTSSDMIRAGYSPSVRLFEAAACATPIISDYWDGLETFFNIGTEILVSGSSEETLHYLKNMSEEERKNIGEKAREKVLKNHTAAHRAKEFEQAVLQVLEMSSATR